METAGITGALVVAVITFICAPRPDGFLPPSTFIAALAFDDSRPAPDLESTQWIYRGFLDRPPQSVLPVEQCVRIC